MKLLWRQAPQPAHDLALALALSEGWDNRMVKTLLNRMLKKGALSYRRYKNLYLYSPAVSEQDCIAAQSESFLERVFDGSLSMLMLHFARHRRLAPRDIEELKRIARSLED